LIEQPGFRRDGNIRRNVSESGQRMLGRASAAMTLDTYAGPIRKRSGRRFASG
jgi:hypothetical protein